MSLAEMVEDARREAEKAREEAAWIRGRLGVKLGEVCEALQKFVEWAKSQEAYEDWPELIECVEAAEAAIDKVRA